MQASSSPRDSHIVILLVGSLAISVVIAALLNSRAKAWLATDPRLNQTPCLPSSSFSVCIFRVTVSPCRSAPGSPYMAATVTSYCESGSAVKSDHRKLWIGLSKVEYNVSGLGFGSFLRNTFSDLSQSC